MARRTRSMMLGLLLAGAACAREPAPSACPAPCPELAPPALGTAAAPVVLDAAARKRHRLELLIAQIDPVLHGIRLSFSADTRFGLGWTWPSYLEPAHLAELIVELERRARELPALGALDEAASRYGRDTLALAMQLRTVVVGATPAEAEPGASPRAPVSADVVQPLFERMRTSSHAIHAALRAAAPLPATPAGARLTLERRCLDAAALLVDVPAAATAEAAPSGPAATVDVDVLRARARACMAAAIDVLDAASADAEAADLGLGVGVSLFREVARLRAGGAVSWGSNAAQSMQYLADRAVKSLDAPP